MTERPVADMAAELDAVLTGVSDTSLRSRLLAASGLPGARLNLALVQEFARGVGAVARRPHPPTDALVALLDGWAALGPDQAPGDARAVILPCAAVAAYGDVAVARPEWWPDELAKLRRAAGDPRWRVREVVAMALQRILGHDWARAVAELGAWTADDDLLVVRAAAAAVAEPALLRVAGRPADAAAVQRAALARLAAVPAAERRRADVRTLRQALGSTVSVVVVASGDVALLEDIAGSDDPDLRWVGRENFKTARPRTR